MKLYIVIIIIRKSEKLHRSLIYITFYAMISFENDQ